MTDQTTDNWTIAILAPDRTAGPPRADGAPVALGCTTHQVSGQDAKDQWSRTIDVLLRLCDGIADATAAWRAEEIEVGLALSDKGELLFIAEAGAEPSVKVTLKRKPQATMPDSWK